MSNGRPRGHGGHMSAEKAKDFKTAMKRLLNYMKRYRLQLAVMMIFAVGSTIFNIVGPKVLGKATTELYEGLVSKISGGAGIDFGKIGEILLFALGLYLISSAFSFIQGFIMTGISRRALQDSGLPVFHVDFPHRLQLRARGALRPRRRRHLGRHVHRLVLPRDLLRRALRTRQMEVDQLHLTAGGVEE